MTARIETTNVKQKMGGVSLQQDKLTIALRQGSRP